ncbi:MAG TPA: hypothetical protein VNY73_02100, partial [Bacteroidia bacterium]|nr:hypothetical protein [Bacteroidia bacterium]
MNFLRLIAFCFIAFILWSCSKQTIEAPPDLGYDYYPGKIGSYVIYDVDSISYRQPKNDTVHYRFQIKEKLDTLFTDNEGRPTIKIIRYKKIYSPSVPYGAMSWNYIQDVWMANKTKTDVEVVEENLRYTKLPFPVKLNAVWNGTAHIDSVECDYKCTTFDEPTSYGNLSFQKTLTVNQLYLPTAISYQNYNEKYARGVGLIYKEITDYKYYQ